MREIKFRAWDKEKKRMYADVGIFPFPWNERTQNNSWSFSADGTTVNPYHENIALMQSTGLKDKNDSEIYEGDILGLDGGGELLLFPVEYEDGCFGIRTNAKDLAELKYYIDMSFVDMEVVGNIHENPELLEEEK